MAPSPLPAPVSDRDRLLAGASTRRRRVHRTAALLLAPLAVATTLVAAATPASAANPAGPDDPIGKVSGVQAVTGGVQMTGWAADPDDLTADATVLSIVDGRIVAATATDVARPKIAAAFGTGPTPGFDVTVPVPSTGVHTACLAVRNVLAGVSTVLNCTTVPLGTYLSPSDLALHDPQGRVGVTWAGSPGGVPTLSVKGFAKEPDFVGRRLTVVLYVDGQPAQTAITHKSTSQQRALGASWRGAFTISTSVSQGTHVGCVWVVNVGLGENSFFGCAAADTRGPAGTTPVTTPAANKTVVTEAEKHVGQPYVWGAEGPKSFDCSGLVMWSYGKANIATPRVSSDQFTAARLIPQSRAVPGDLVFYHNSVGDVYHVGIYLKPGRTVAAIDEQQGVDYQTIWDASSATYGSFTHT